MGSIQKGSMKMGAYLLYFIGGIIQVVQSCKPSDENKVTKPTSPAPTTLKQTTKKGCIGTPSDIYTEDGLQCILPFSDGRKEHTTCADFKGQYQWCATSLKSSCRYLKWGKCLLQEKKSTKPAPTTSNSCSGVISKTTFSTT